MTTLLTKHSTLILIFLVLAFFALAWPFPSEGLMLGAAFLLLNLLIVSVVVFQKHKEMYLQGKISRSMFLRNVLVEITGIVLVMVLAGLLGRYLAGMVMSQIASDIARLVMGLLIGLSTGMIVGTLIRQAWDLGVVQKLHATDWRLK